MLYSEFINKLHVIDKLNDGALLAVCPAHPDRVENPHLRVSVSDQDRVLIVCRVGCKNDRIIEELGMTMRDLATIDVTDAPDVRVSATREPAGGADVAALAVQLDEWADALDQDSIDYVQRRFGMRIEDMNRLGLGTDTSGKVKRVVVPFRTHKGVPRNYQARDITHTHDVKWLGPKSPESGRWSPLAWLSSAHGSPEVLITEGPGDGLTAVAMGYDVIFIAGAGNAKRDDIADEIVEWVAGRPVVLCGDGDGPGATFNSDLSASLTARGLTVRVLPMPDGLDLGDRFAAEGHGLMRTLIQEIAAAPVVSATEAASAALEARWDEDQYPLDDLGAARFLLGYITEKGSGVHYTPQTGFMVYDGGVWTRDPQKTLLRAYAHEVGDMLREITISLAKVAKGLPEGDPRIAKAARFQSFTKHVRGTTGFSNMIAEIKALPGVACDFREFDQAPWAFAYRNGFTDIRTGEFTPEGPEMQRLKLTKRFDFDRDPDAKAPRWVKFLEDCHPDGHENGILEYLRRVSGYTFTGYANESAMFIHWGPTARNGKSTFMETLQQVGIQFTATAASDTFEKRANSDNARKMSKFVGARCIVTSEGNEGSVFDNSMVKNLTGNESVEVKYLYQESFSIRLSGTPHFLTNHRPEIRGVDPAIWERLKVVVWPRHFAPEERDKLLGEKLLEQKQGIALWLEGGAIDWWKDGQDLREPQAVRDAVTSYQTSNDPLIGFYADAQAQAEGYAGRYLEVTDPVAKQDSWVTAEDLWIGYATWCRDEGMNPKDMWTRNTFLRQMGHRPGVTKSRNAAGIILRGIRRATTDEETGATDESTVADEFNQLVSTVTEPAPRIVTGPSLGDLEHDVINF